MTSKSNRFSKGRLRQTQIGASVFILVASQLLTTSVFGQDRPFDNLQFGVVGGMDFVETELQETWSIPAVFEVSIGTPFYIGNAALSATYLPASSRTSEITDFWAIYAGVGLTYPVELGSRLEVRPGFRFGSMYMNFNDEPVAFRKQESEIFVGAVITLSAAVTSSARIQVSSTFLHTFTETPIDVSLFSIGVEYSIPTPGWLRRVLQ